MQSAQSVVSRPAPTESAPSPARLTVADKIALFFLGFFLLVAFTAELYWLLFHASLPARAPHSFLANLFRIYGDADRAYYDAVTSFSLCLEGINVFFTQILNVWLIVAILKRRPERYALQLTISSYLSYSVVLYFLHMQVAGFAEMNGVSLRTLLLFYGINMPWLAGHLYMMWDAAAAITRRFARES